MPRLPRVRGRGLNIITALADDWGVRDDVEGEVTVWVLVHGDVHDPDAGHPHDAFATRVTRPRTGRTPLPDLALPSVAAASGTALSGAAAGEVARTHLSAAHDALPHALRTGIPEAVLPGVPDPAPTGVPDTTLTGMTGPDVSLSGLAAPGLSLPDLSGLEFTDAFEDLD